MSDTSEGEKVGEPVGRRAVLLTVLAPMHGQSANINVSAKRRPNQTRVKAKESIHRSDVCSRGTGDIASQESRAPGQQPS